ncbi:MAG: hypothetical protein ACLFSY_10665 [Desulfonatronovibrionaceae bacterium]
MGQEVSWYLRFTRGNSLEVLAAPGALSQLKNTLHLEPQWDLEIEEYEGHIRALFTRKQGRG